MIYLRKVASALVCCAMLLTVLFVTACGYRPTVRQPQQPPAVLPELPPIRTMATFSHTMAIGVDGSLWSEGSNVAGELGDGTTLSRWFFDQIGTDTDWASIDTGSWHTVAIKTDGSLWAWGSYNVSRLGANGALGNGTRAGSSIPIQIGTDTDWAMATAGSIHTVAIKTDGSLWAWGSNSDGQLGNGRDRGLDSGSLVPIQIGTDTDWVYVAASHGQTFAIKTDGSLWAWGDNQIGQLGDGTRERRLYPVRIGGDSTWSMIALESDHTLGIQTDGSLWAWGYNWNGRLGDGTMTSRLSPVRIGTYYYWASVAAGGGYSVAVREDGSLWVWGARTPLFFGGLATRDRTVPTQIYPDEHWVSVTAGNLRAFAITKDGRIQRLG